MSEMPLTQDMLAAFGRHLRFQEKSPYTIEKYLRDANAFLRFASGRPLEKELAADYKNHLIESGKYADSSINSMLASLRGLFKFLNREDCCVSRIRTQEMPYCPENRSLTMEEYQQLLAAAEEDDRLQMALKVLAGTGIRISELKYFTVEALQKKEQYSSVRVSCKKKSREILIPDDLRAELLDYIKRRGIEEGVIICTKSGNPIDRSNFWRQMKGLCKKTDVEWDKVFPHNVRKLFARTFYEKSHDIAQLACLLGHSSINTTAIYVKRTEREVRAKVDWMIKEILCGNRRKTNPRASAGDERRANSRTPRGDRKKANFKTPYGSGQRGNVKTSCGSGQRANFRTPCGDGQRTNFRTSCGDEQWANVRTPGRDGQQGNVKVPCGDGQRANVRTPGRDGRRTNPKAPGMRSRRDEWNKYGQKQGSGGKKRKDTTLSV